MFPAVLFHQVSLPKPCISLSPIRATRPTHLIVPKLITHIKFHEYTNNNAHYAILPAHSSSSLGPRIFLHALFSNTVSVCSSHNSTDKFCTHTPQHLLKSEAPCDAWQWAGTAHPPPVSSSQLLSQNIDSYIPVPNIFIHLQCAFLCVNMET